MGEVGDVLLWLLCYLVGFLVTFAALAGVLYCCHLLVRLALRTPGPLGRGVRAWERTDPGTPAGCLAICVLLGFLVSLVTGFLGQLLILSGIS